MEMAHTKYNVFYKMDSVYICIDDPLRFKSFMTISVVVRSMTQLDPPVSPGSSLTSSW